MIKAGDGQTWEFNSFDHFSLDKLMTLDLEGLPSSANHAMVDLSNPPGHRCPAIFAQLAATRTRPPVFHATDAQLASTKTRKEAATADCALLAQALASWDPSPLLTVAARLDPSTLVKTAASPAFPVVKGWSVRWLRPLEVSGLESPARAPNLLLGVVGWVLGVGPALGIVSGPSIFVHPPRFQGSEEATFQPWRTGECEWKLHETDHDRGRFVPGGF